MKTEKIPKGRHISKWIGIPKSNIQYRTDAVNDHFPPRIRNFLLKSTENDLQSETEPKSKFIWGEVHSGKTIHASRIMLDYLKIQYLNSNDNKKALFINFPDLLLEIKNTFRHNAEITEFEVIQKYREIDFLVIDDFLSVKPTDFVVDILYIIINHRYDFLKTTIITSNFSLPEIENLLKNQRISRRLGEMCEIIHFSHKNRDSENRV